MGDRHVNASPGTLILGDRELTMSPLTDKELTQLDDWVREQYVSNALKAIPIDIAEATRQRMELHIIDKAARLSCMTGEGASLIATPRGMAKLVHVSLHSDDITIEELTREMYDPNNIRVVNRKFTEINTDPKQSALREKGHHSRRTKSTGNSRKRTTTRRKKSRK